MSMFSKAAVAAGLVGTLVIGYCIYFDHKRRSDPEFKKKLRLRRKRYRMAEDARSAQRTRPLPDLRNHEAVQTFFLQEVQLGEEMLGRGDVEQGVDHLCNAIAVCGQPHQLLQVMQQTLPPAVFQSLLRRLPVVSKKFNENTENSNVQMQEDDVE